MTPPPTSKNKPPKENPPCEFTFNTDRITPHVPSSERFLPEDKDAVLGVASKSSGLDELSKMCRHLLDTYGYDGLMSDEDNPVGDLYDTWTVQKSPPRYIFMAKSSGLPTKLNTSKAVAAIVRYLYKMHKQPPPTNTGLTTTESIARDTSHQSRAAMVDQSGSGYTTETDDSTTKKGTGQMNGTKTSGEIVEENVDTSKSTGESTGGTQEVAEIDLMATLMATLMAEYTQSSQVVPTLIIASYWRPTKPIKRSTSNGPLLVAANG